MHENVQKAKALAGLGIWVFPVVVRPVEGNPYKTTKKPLTANGFLDATIDPFLVEDLWERKPDAEVGVWMGPSGLVALDIDVKRNPSGEIEVDGFENFENQWLDLPDTFAFDSISGAGGRQYVYAAPEGKNLAPASNYRGIQGVDRRGGGSYSVWAGSVPESREEFAPAPEWLLDEAAVRTAAKFEGSVKEWYDTLEPGEPSLIVRKAMERAEQKFAQHGNDLSHSDIVELQYEAVRLGAEGHAGVPQLLEKIEDLFYSRTGSHTRSEAEWGHEFAEALASGIEKAGDAIELRKSLPEYSLSKVPTSVPDRLVSGAPAGKEVFRELLAALLAATDDDLLVTSILWNSPRTKDLAREWGLQFTHQRVLDARETPEPVRENPALEERKKVAPVASEGFLTAEERAVVDSNHTFIEEYLEASHANGFTNPTYAVPSAWTALSMAMGRKGMIPLGKDIGVNLWFLVLGPSTSGKSTSDAVLLKVLDYFMKGGDVHYNLGATSSPEGMTESLLMRDGLSSIVHHDEASDFFMEIKSKDWMKTLMDRQSKWYEGYVPPEQKIRLKNLRGKDARTSFNMHMLGTPDRLLSQLDLTMFESGYLARTNWVWAEAPGDPERKYKIRLNPNRKRATTHPAIVSLGVDLAFARAAFKDLVVMSTTEEVQDRINQAHRDFDARAKKHKKYDRFYMAVDRLGMETLWKCAFLLALYEGRKEVWMEDALTAIAHAEVWLETLMRVADEISESPYSRDVEEIEKYIRDEGGTVTRPALLHAFKGMIVKTQREIDDRINFLLDSGRIVRNNEDGGAILYSINGH